MRKHRLITLSIGDNTADLSRHSTDACLPAHTDESNIVNAKDPFGTRKETNHFLHILNQMKLTI